MGAERAQGGGRGWVRIPASRGEQPPAGPAPGPGPGFGSGSGPGFGPGSGPGFGPGPGPGFGSGFASGEQHTIYLALLSRWREAGRTLPGHPDEEWERLISQPCWPGR
ncbi:MULTISPECIES: hypothetical protein [unclassified Streptomyces]|uniref:hypothetical protein n=1 Tax=unclassified Streptomyces TaxID=2593676 RepID=UPI002E2FE6A7|nr:MULTISPECIES: hypothetical protein [unclassified Streptomyces]WUC66060.1 hypothetical protein OG861_18465 [Streptomyces sp. NBC_00539]